MKTHELKVWPFYFEEIVEGRKNFEFRKNDRGFRTGDIIYLEEWNPEEKKFTGAWIPVEITYIMRTGFGLPDGMVIMSFRKRMDLKFTAPMRIRG